MKHQHVANKPKPGPVLRNWRRIAVDGGMAILIGEVSGHPLLGDGWMTSSPLLAFEPASGWAQTESRRYVLAEPYPDDCALPDAAVDALVSRMLAGVGALALEDLPRALAEFETIARKLAEPIAAETRH